MGDEDSAEHRGALAVFGKLFAKRSEGPDGAGNTTKDNDNNNTKALCAALEKSLSPMLRRPSYFLVILPAMHSDSIPFPTSLHSPAVRPPNGTGTRVILIPRVILLIAIPYINSHPTDCNPIHKSAQ